MSTPADDSLTALSTGVASVLPFLYVAWADGLLRPDEMAAVQRQVAAQDWLTDADKAVLARWLDPEAPPSASTYFGWVRTLRQAVAHIPDSETETLAQLGTALADLADAGGDGAGATPEARQALAEMEGLLGIVGREAVRHLLDTPPEPEAPPAPAPTDVAAVRALLDGPHAALRDRVRSLLTEPAFAYLDPETPKAAYRDKVLAWTRRLADEGLGALSYPAYAGGQGSIGAFIAAFETLAYHDLSLVIKYGVQFGLFGGSIAQLGSEEQRRALLPRVGTLELPGCFAMTERLHGSNVRDLATTATLDRETDEWVVQTPTEADHKEWIGNAAAHGQMATVFAQLVIGGDRCGVHAFLVPIRSAAGDVLPGVRIADSGHKMGLNGIDNGQIWFDGVRVPRENLLSRFAQVDADGIYHSPIPSEGKRFFVMLGTLVGGRIAVGSGAVSAAKAGLAIAIRYAERRRQFGPAGGGEVPLMDYLSHQRRLLPLLATSYGLTFALHDLAESFAALPPDGETQETEAAASALKAMASWHATRALQEAREACGGEGYRWSTRIAHRKADSDIFTTFEGDNTVLQLQVAKGLLSGYRQEFADMNVFTLLRYLRGRADARLGDLNLVARTRADQAHLLDPAWHRDLFERRERTLLISAAARLKARIDRGVDSFEAFVEVQDHLLTLASAHAERRVLLAFQAAVARAPEGSAREVLGRLCALYALWHVEQDRAWFLEQNVFESGVAKAVRTEVNTLLGLLRPHALDLVDAFGIPDAVLGSELV
jgi:acyl-CoA oxidase